MVLSKHIKERMAQRGYNLLMLEFIISCDEIDYEHKRYFMSRSSKETLRNELLVEQKRLRFLKLQVSQLKKERAKIIAVSG